MLTAGLGGAARQVCVALSASGTVVSVCGQERITRTKAAAFNATGLPDEALDVSIGQLGWRRGDVTRYVMAEPGVAQVGSLLVVRIDHHFAHACISYLTSPFPSAAIVVCDHEAPAVSVWLGRGAGPVQTSLRCICWPSD